MNNNLDNANAPPQTMFSTIVTAISGARQSANQEFNRFWERITNNTAKSSFPQTQSTNIVHQTPRNQILRSTSFVQEGDLARIEAGKTIHGRLVPDNHRRLGHVKNAEIQTDESLDNKNFSIKRKSSLTQDDENQLRPRKVARTGYSYPHNFSTAASCSTSARPLERTTPPNRRQSLVAESLAPIDSAPIPANLTPTREITSNNLSPDRFTLPAASPMKASSVRASPLNASLNKIPPFKASPITKPTSPVKSSPVKSSPFRTSSFQRSPIRSTSNSPIKTGSTKSVKRLTFELEEAFSPRFPLPVGQPRRHSAAYDSSDPFFSTPLIRNKANNNASTQSAPCEDTQTTTSSDHFTINNVSRASYSTTSETSSTVSYVDNHLATKRTESNVFPATPSLHKSPSKRLDQDEEDRRIEELERNVSTIKSQMNNYVSYSSMRSPKPSHTITTEVDHSTTISHKRDYPTPREEVKILSPIRTSTSFESSTSRSTALSSPQTAATRLQSSSTPNRLAGSAPPQRESTSARASPSINQSTNIKISDILPASSDNTAVNSPHNDSRTPPSAPPAPPVKIVDIPKTFSPVRDIPNAFLTRRFHSPATNSPPKSIKESQLAPFLGPNIAIKEKVPLKPSNEHKSTMRELIQLIPGVKLKKTDRIIGPDGKERPNPFWNEIYNRSGRKVY